MFDVVKIHWNRDVATVLEIIATNITEAEAIDRRKENFFFCVCPAGTYQIGDKYLMTTETQTQPTIKLELTDKQLEVLGTAIGAEIVRKTETLLEKLAIALNKETEIGEDGLNRFDRTRAQLLQQLAITLQKFPYIRLGQLLSNSIPEGTDIFYVTDAKLIQLLKDFEVQHGLS